MRQALNHAIDKEALLTASLPPGSKAAIQYMPDLVNGYNPNVTTYGYDWRRPNPCSRRPARRT